MPEIRYLSKYAIRLNSEEPNLRPLKLRSRCSPPHPALQARSPKFKNNYKNVAMAPKISLNAQNLEALGAMRLAELLIEISDGNAAVKRRLRLELAGAQSPDEASREIRKRLSAISRSRTFVDWQN